MKQILAFIVLISLTVTIDARSKKVKEYTSYISDMNENVNALISESSSEHKLSKEKERILFKTLLSLGSDREYLALSKFQKSLVIRGFEELAQERGIESKRVINLIRIMRELLIQN